MRDDNGDSSMRHAVATEESNPLGVRSEAVPDAEKQDAKVGRARSMLQSHRVIILAISLAVVVGGGYLIRNAFLYEGTDDAQVDGHIMPLSARINGYVYEVPVIEGQIVHAGNVLVTIDPKDYKISVDQAQATFADAQATAASSRFNIPITSVTTRSNLDSAGTAVLNAQAGVKAAEQNFESAKAAL
jgi:membrane fusion protein (multidrug efflux system)